MDKKYYVCIRGYNPGVHFTTWEEFTHNVDGYRNNMYAAFSNKTKAFAYYYENISKKNLKELKHEIKYQNNEQTQDKNLEHNNNFFENKFDNF